MAVTGDEPENSEVLPPIPGRENDPTLMRNQAALRRSQGRIWIVAGAIFTAVSLVVFLPSIPFRPALAWAGTGSVLGLFAAMIVVRFAVRPHGPRMLVLAILLFVLAAAGLTFAVLIGMTEWESLQG